MCKRIIVDVVNNRVALVLHHRAIWRLFVLV